MFCLSQFELAREVAGSAPKAPKRKVIQDDDDDDEAVWDDNDDESAYEVSMNGGRTGRICFVHNR